MPFLHSNPLRTFRNTVKLVYDRVQSLNQPSLVLFWRQAVLGLYQYLTFTRN